MKEQVKRISDKLKLLKRLDPKLSVFGARSHKYKLNPVVLIETIKEFEANHKIKLPEDYVEFLTVLGNGGAGPYYGLEPLEDSLFSDLDYKNPDKLLNLSIPFMHSEAWNMDSNLIPETDDDDENDRLIEEFNDEYYSEKYLPGGLALCNYGCGVNLYLIVNGLEYGNIWTDDRGSDGGIYPSDELGNTNRITFLDWYELWLNNSLIKVEKQKTQKSEQPKNETNKKPWWKFWQ